jgi:hypothetical protein
MRRPSQLSLRREYGGSSRCAFVSVAFASCRRTTLTMRLGLVAFLAPDLACNTARPYWGVVNIRILIRLTSLSPL